MRLSVVPALWPGEAIREIESMTRLAAESGCHEIWFSEVNGYEAFSLATGLASSGATGGSDLVVGPLPLRTRSPALLAQAVTSLSCYSGGRISVALGASSAAIVEGWHGARFKSPVEAMETYVPALLAAAVGERTDHSGPGWSTKGFKLNVPAPGPPGIVIAALGERMLALAGALADRVVVNLVTPRIFAELKEAVVRGAREAGRETPPVIVWVTAGSAGYAAARVASMLPAYVGAGGYRERLEQMALSDVIRDDPGQAADRLGMFDPGSLLENLAAWSRAGADELAIVMSGADPAAAGIVSMLADENWSIGE